MISFGRFTLDPTRRELLAGGERVRLASRTFDLLECLVEARGQVVSKEQIVARVWHGQQVAENNLTVQISNLRRVLAEHEETNLIGNVPGRGYQLLAEIVVAPEPDPAAPVRDRLSGPAAVADTDISRNLTRDAAPLVPPIRDPAASVGVSPGQGARGRRGRPFLAAAFGIIGLAAGVLTLRGLNNDAVPPGNSLAIMPFPNKGADRAQDVVAEAITEDLTVDLAHVPGTTVIAHESAVAVDSRGLADADIGRALKVRYLVRGSLVPEEGHFHITAYLIEAATGTQLWSARFDTQLAGLAETRDAIVRRIASALDVRLTDLASAAASHDRPDNEDATLLFYRARDIIEHDDSLAAFANAQQLLEQAINQTDNFPDALAQLGLTLMLKVVSNDDPDDTRDEQEADVVLQRALAVAPHNVTALAAMARLQRARHNCDAATLSANAALAAEPNDIDALTVLGQCALVAGDVDRAGDVVMAALRLNPEGRVNKPRYDFLAEVRLLQGRYAEAIDYANRAIAGDPEPQPGEAALGRPDFARLLLIAAAQLNGDTDTARKLFLDHARIWPRHTTWRIAAYAPRKIGESPAYHRFMAALHAAGVPDYADEHVDDHVVPPSVIHHGGDFDATPTTLPGGTVIDTQGLVALRAKANPLLIDVGRGVGVIPGASWSAWDDPQRDHRKYVNALLETPALTDRDTPIVVMGDGTYGYDPYNIALLVIAHGYRHVCWYRGGEEAWARAGLPATDKRRE